MGICHHICVLFGSAITYLAFVDVAYSEHALREKPGVIDSVAGNGEKSVVGQPFGVEFGPDGGLYVCGIANHRIQRVRFEK